MKSNEFDYSKFIFTDPAYICIPPGTSPGNFHEPFSKIK